MDDWMDVQIDDGWMDGGWMDCRKMDGWIARWMDDRQIEYMFIVPQWGNCSFPAAANILNKHSKKTRIKIETRTKYK